jgi:hypothetical protein
MCKFAQLYACHELFLKHMTYENTYRDDNSKSILRKLRFM